MKFYHISDRAFRIYSGTTMLLIGACAALCWFATDLSTIKAYMGILTFVMLCFQGISFSLFKPSRQMENRSSAT
jgi:hypothetical protein